MVEVGDRVALESERLGEPVRQGMVLAIRGHMLEIRWDDGHVSTLLPKVGALRVIRDATEAATK